MRLWTASLETYRYLLLMSVRRLIPTYIHRYKYQDIIALQVYLEQQFYNAIKLQTNLQKNVYYRTSSKKCFTRN